ncbi:MAG TPA: response regulator transcription factor [Verrucomicrobiae bacterium]|jgi:two-component system KDP operon response regulator KdpE|nr:response regulator transcription factor [Verrucomicrobiae bacterium]
MNNTIKKKVTVLIIDDEVHMRRMLQVYLERNEYEVKVAATGDEGINKVIEFQPDVILLDLGLPDMDGLEVLKRLREWTQTPIFVVSVRAREEEKIAALDKGANDYLTKPFGTGELLARLRVVRRYGQTQSATEIFKSGHLEVDLASRLVKVKGRAIKLSPTEYSLLALFVQHAGKLLTQDYLLREIWGSSDPARMGALRVYIRYLREKIETDPAMPEILITESGIGYRLIAQD